jgi:AcrR family transcriptional regulator
MITREKIIEVASLLFVEHGVKTITIDRIVKQLHTSKRTIYKHFKDKTTLLEACLAVYHQTISKENETIIRDAENAIQAMGYLHQRIVFRASQTNPNFFNDILHYYPGLLQKSYRATGNFASRQLADLANWGLKDGLFRKDMDIEVTSKTVLALLELLKDTNRFPVDQYSKERLTFGIMIPYLRGVCTTKGLEQLEQQEELFKIML